MTEENTKLDPISTEQAQDLLMSLFTLARQLRPSGTTKFSSDSEPPAPRHVLALFHLSTKGPMSVSDLASSLGVTLTTASLAVTQMANLGLVDREEDPTDHRRTIVSISDKVKDIVNETITIKLEFLKQGLQSLGPQRTQSLVNDLHCLVQNLEHDSDSSR